LASSTKRRSSLKDQDFRTIAKKLPLQTSCNLQINYKMSTQAVSRSPKSIKGSLKKASAARGTQLARLLCETCSASRHFVNRRPVPCWQSRIAPKAPRDLVTA
jgi:hypothetical protein